MQRTMHRTHAHWLAPRVHRTGAVARPAKPPVVCKVQQPRAVGCTSNDGVASSCGHGHVEVLPRAIRRGGHCVPDHRRRRPRRVRHWAVVDVPTNKRAARVSGEHDESGDQGWASRTVRAKTSGERNWVWLQRSECGEQRPLSWQESQC